jgi:hypothetical protein
VFIGGELFSYRATATRVYTGFGSHQTLHHLGRADDPGAEEHR